MSLGLLRSNNNYKKQQHDYANDTLINGAVEDLNG